jgi:hypothetical protein
MMADRYEVLGPRCGEVGGELAHLVDGDPDGTYLYVEAGNGWYEYGVFKDDGNSIRYIDPSSELGELIWKALKTLEPNKRWAVMEYEIKGTKFSARFKFPDEIDVDSFDLNRRDIAVSKHFGDKPIIYPPITGAPPSKCGGRRMMNAHRDSSRTE